MKVSKRDFLKLLTAGGTVAGLAGTTPATVTPHTTEELAIDDNHVTPDPTMQYPFLEAVDNVLFDRFRIEPGQEIPLQIRLFCGPFIDPITGGGAYRSQSQTNMHMGNVLPAPNQYWIQRIHLVVDPSISDADYRTVKTWNWTLYLAQKRYAGGTLFLDVQKAPWKDLLSRKVRVTRRSLEFPNKKGLMIPSQMYFDPSIGTQSGQADHKGTGIDFAMGLEGIEFRGVQ